MMKEMVSRHPESIMKRISNGAHSGTMLNLLLRLYTFISSAISVTTIFSIPGFGFQHQDDIASVQAPLLANSHTISSQVSSIYLNLKLERLGRF